jgi:hypothetical protein
MALIGSYQALMFWQCSIWMANAAQNHHSFITDRCTQSATHRGISRTKMKYRCYCTKHGAAAGALPSNYYSTHWRTPYLYIQDENTYDRWLKLQRRARVGKYLREEQQAHRSAYMHAYGCCCRATCVIDYLVMMSRMSEWSFVYLQL